MKNFLKELVELFFPSRCLLCRNYSRDALCAVCFNKIKIVPLRLKMNSSIQSVFWDGAFSAAIYEGVLRQAIHLLKYKNKIKLAHPLGNLLVEFYERVLDLNIDAVVPVPIFSGRLKKRNYNQSYLLARRIAEDLNLRLDDNFLIKIKDTVPQNKLSREERFRNVKDSFAVNLQKKEYKNLASQEPFSREVGNKNLASQEPFSQEVGNKNLASQEPFSREVGNKNLASQEPFSREVGNRNILLIDDIITTGATAGECARVLKQAGVQKVYLLTLAKA